MSNMKVDTLRRIGIFNELNSSELESIIHLVREETFPVNTLLFNENDEGDSLYILCSGLVKISKGVMDNREKTLAILSAGTLFGEMSLIDGSPRSATARTLEETRVFIVDRDNFQRMVEDNPHIGVKILQGLVRMLSQRLRETNEQISNLVMWGLASH